MTKSRTWRYLGVYTLAFLVVGLVVFSPFIAGGRSLIWHTDGLTQHIKALSYYGMLLRGVVDSLASGQGLYLPGFAFSIGYGSDIVDTLSYYVIGDPLNLLSVFVPEESTPVLYSALLIARLYLAGLAFSLFARYAFQPPRAGLLAGALTYVFCGFALYAAVRHPYFANPLLYFPLVLYGVERVLRERKHGAFALSLALCTVSNFYFFYMIFVLMALYIIMRLVARHHAEGPAGVKAAFADLGWLFAAGCVGVLIGCCVFVPTVLYFLQDSRASIEHTVPLLYSGKYYSLLLLNASTTSDPGRWSYLSIGIVGVIALGSLFAERKANTQLKVAAVAFAMMLCVPFVGYAFNGFSYIANRWCWAFCFVGALAVATRWQALTQLTKRQALVLVGLVALYLAACTLLNWGNVLHMGLVIVAALWLLSAIGIAVASTLNDKRRTVASARVAGGMLIVVTCAGICLNGLALYSPMGGDYVNSFLKADEVCEIYSTEATAVADLNDDAFYRYSSSYVYANRNAGMLAGQPSTTYYWSLTNVRVKDFFHLMGINGSDYKGYCWHDLNDQSLLSELVGVKYYAAKTGELTPYGYDDEPLAHDTLYDTRNSEHYAIDLYRNKTPLPFGFTYTSTLDADSFAALPPEHRREAALQACVVSEGTRSLPTDVNALSLSATSVPYNMKPDENAEIDGNALTVKQKNATVTLDVDAPANAEVTLQFDGLKVGGSSATTFEVPVTFTFANGSKQTRSLNFASPDSVSYEPFQYVVVSPGYSDAALKSIRVKFPAKGTYTWDDLKVIAQPFDNYDSTVAKLTEDVMQDVNLHYLNAQTTATNRVTGRISLQQGKVLCTQIPYSEGWRVTVDGQDAELLCLNCMLAGVALGPGEHTLEFTYETPGATAGALLTVVGLALFALLLVVQRKGAGEEGARRGKHASR